MTVRKICISALVSGLTFSEYKRLHHGLDEAPAPMSAKKDWKDASFAETSEGLYSLLIYTRLTLSAYTSTPRTNAIDAKGSVLSVATNSFLQKHYSENLETNKPTRTSQHVPLGFYLFYPVQTTCDSLTRMDGISITSSRETNSITVPIEQASTI